MLGSRFATLVVQYACVLSGALTARAQSLESSGLPQSLLHTLAEGADGEIPWIRDPYRRLDLKRRSSTTQAPRVVHDRGLLLDSALARAGLEQRLVLAYLPRIEGRPMYRAPVVDDYARLALWADPELASCVRRRFVPLRIYADRSVAARLGLGNADPKSTTYLDALEPAIVFLTPKGEVVHRIDRIRSFSATWMRAQLIAVLREHTAFARPSLQLELAKRGAPEREPSVREGSVRGQALIERALWRAQQELADAAHGACRASLRRVEKQLEDFGAALGVATKALAKEQPAGPSPEYSRWAARARQLEGQVARAIELELEALLVNARLLRLSERAALALERLNSIEGGLAELAFAHPNFALEKARCLVARGAFEEALKAIDLGAPTCSETEWLRGAAQWQLHRREEAEKSFVAAVRFAGQPFAARAAAMLARSEDTTRRSPLAHGFEMLVEPLRASLSGKPARTTELRREGPAAEALPIAVRAGLERLLATQYEDGSWDDARYAYWPSPAILPNVRTAVTALAATALLSWRKLAPARVDAALAKAKAYLGDDSRVALGTEEEVYSHAYRMLFWARCASLAWGAPGEPVAKMSSLVKRASAIQDKRSGFFAHEYKNAFCTASMMWSLHRVAQEGVQVDEGMIRLGVAALRVARRKDGSYSYSGTAEERDAKREAAPSITRLKDASARMPVCEAVLQAFGSSDAARVRHAFETFLRYLDRLARVRKADFHSDGQLAGFFFWHAVFHASEAMVFCDAALRERVRARVLDLTTSIQEIDGSFIDSHELGKSYGTAMALLTLDNLRAR